jgi:hypothetical protein
MQKRVVQCLFDLTPRLRALRQVEQQIAEKQFIKLALGKHAFSS